MNGIVENNRITLANTCAEINIKNEIEKLAEASQREMAGLNAYAQQKVFEVQVARLLARCICDSCPNVLISMVPMIPDVYGGEYSE